MIHKLKLLQIQYQKQHQIDAASFSNASAYSERLLNVHLEQLAMEQQKFSLQEGPADIFLPWFLFSNVYLIIFLLVKICQILHLQFLFQIWLIIFSTSYVCLIYFFLFSFFLVTLVWIKKWIYRGYF